MRSVRNISRSPKDCGHGPWLKTWEEVSITQIVTCDFYEVHSQDQL